MDNRPIQKILLVDDNEGTNFYHRIILEETKLVKEIIAKQSVKEALAYLKTEVDGCYPQPDIIFLDINMPGLSGWDFLNAYAELKSDQKAGNIIIMLTTSLNVDDRDKANCNSEIKEFRNKPLTEQVVSEIYEKYLKVTST